MDLDLDNKVVLVTGGAKGIGAAIVRALAREGAVPVVVDRDESAPRDDSRASWLRLAHRIEIIVADLTDAVAVPRGGGRARIAPRGRIDAVVNNAGVNDRVGLESGSPAAFVESLGRNLVHVYAVTHHALPALKASRGAIVNIASKVAMTGQGGTSGYAAGEGRHPRADARVGRRAAAGRHSRERRRARRSHDAALPSSGSAPSPIRCARWPTSRPGSRSEHRMTTADEIAATVVFLLSPRSAHTTGQHVVVDGGYVHLDRAVR